MNKKPVFRDNGGYRVKEEVLETTVASGDFIIDH